MCKVKTILIGGVVILGLAGCYEPSGVTVHQPGVYKGSEDPLLKADTAKRKEELIARFNQVQRDR